MLNMHTETTIGIDISKASFDVAMLRDEEYQIGQFENKPAGFRKLVKWLKKRGAEGSHVCLEATGRYGQGLAIYLHEAGYRVSVLTTTAPDGGGHPPFPQARQRRPADRPRPRRGR